MVLSGCGQSCCADPLKGPTTDWLGLASVDGESPKKPHCLFWFRFLFFYRPNRIAAGSSEKPQEGHSLVGCLILSDLNQHRPCCHELKPRLYTFFTFLSIVFVRKRHFNLFEGSRLTFMLFGCMKLPLTTKDCQDVRTNFLV